MKRVLLLHVAAAFRKPSSKQIEAYARFVHTLAAAAVIGAITLVFAEGGITWSLLWRLIGLVVSGVACFLMGAVMLEDR